MKQTLALTAFVLLLFMGGFWELMAINEKPELSQAKAFLALPLEQALQKTKRLTSREAKELVSKVRYLSRGTNPNLDHLYFLVQHLESLQATELAQHRLENLLWVISLTLLLFCGFLIYMLFDQKRSIAMVKEWNAARESLTKEKDKSSPVYRGD